MAGVTPTAALLAFAQATHTLPPQVSADATRLLADTLAVGAAGAASAQAAKVFESACRMGAGQAARFIGGGRAPETSAAFFNGFAIHCLEWDAVHEPAVVHAMSVVTAALLAASDRRGGSDPNEALTALAVGVEIASGLGIAATGPMRFFRPATAGVVGAALAVARLDGLSVAKMADVLGLAYSFAGGTMQAHAEGSVALPLQIGRAAQAAVQAVDLVKSGLTGPHDVLEGPFGYTALIEPLDLSRMVGDLGTKWQISEISTKPYPCGRASHAVLATLAAIRSSRRPMDQIIAHVPPLIARLVSRPITDDMTPAYARLCLPLLTALMLRTGRIDPRRFTPEDFNDPLVREIAAKITIEVDDNSDPNALSPQRLVIDGDSIDIPHTLGSPAAPMDAQQTAQKRDLCEVLAAPVGDRRLLDDPLDYFTRPLPHSADPLAVTPDWIRGPASSAPPQKRDPGSSPG
jgi:2-methylcitrate dehydratase PrpD